MAQTSSSDGRSCIVQTSAGPARRPSACSLSPPRGFLSSCVAVSPVAEYRLKTLLHEIAHVMLGHATDCADGERPCSRGVGE